jgi:hypothetical protein
MRGDRRGHENRGPFLGWPASRSDSDRQVGEILGFYFFDEAFYCASDSGV